LDANGRLKEDKMSREIEKCIHFLKEKYEINISNYNSSFPQKGIKNRIAVTSSEKANDLTNYYTEAHEENHREI
jgi:hypothetical protein